MPTPYVMILAVVTIGLLIFFGLRDIFRFRRYIRCARVAMCGHGKVKLPWYKAKSWRAKSLS